MSAPRGFTLIELLVVIAIIGLMSTIAVVSLNSARERARDAKRLSDIAQIQKVLEIYYDTYGRYPTGDGDGCGGWDVGNQDSAANRKLLSNTALPDSPAESMLRDPTATGNCAGYHYYRYPAGSNGCDSSKGAFYVLGIFDMEASSRPHPQSPGWRCPNRNWQSELDWVTGRFENP